MFKAIKNFFTAPSCEGDLEKTQDLKTVHRVALALLGLAAFSIPFIFLLEQPTRNFALYATIVGLLLWLLIIYLIKRGKTNTSKFIILIVNTLNIFGVIYATSGLSRPTIFTTIFLLAIANLLFPKRGAIIYGITLLIASSLIFGLGTIGMAPEPTVPNTELSNYFIYVFTLIASASVLAISSANSQLNTKDVINTTEELRVRNAELDRLSNVLESRIEERTAILKKKAAQQGAIAEISQAISDIQDREHQLLYITQAISEKLGYYHVAIFLLDNDQEYALMRAASSPGGQIMLAEEHKLRIGQQGIIGDVAQSGQSRIALDVGEDAAYFGNPHLPETRSEIAFPLFSSGALIGVLDVQSIEEYAFFTEDIEVMSTLARQVAAVIENTRLFEKMQAALAQTQQTLQQYTKEGWTQYAKSAEHKGMLFADEEITKLSKVASSPDIKNALQSNELVETQETLSVPVQVRGETIGVLGFRSKSGPRKWTREEIALMKSAAERSALALENARMLETTVRRAGREHLVSEITTKIRETNDPQMMIQTALDELKEALGASKIELAPEAPKVDETENVEEN